MDERRMKGLMGLCVRAGQAVFGIDLIDKVYLKDDILSVEEDEALRTIMITPSGSTTIEKRLAMDKDAYAEVAYRFGLAYFYYYKEDGNKQMAAKWFSIATSQRRLPKARQERASRLGKIAQYYATIGKESKSGDKEVSYRDYWDDLVAISEGNIAKVDNVVTALVIYKEIAGQVYDKAAKFYADGVTVQEMADELYALQDHLDKDITEFDLTEKHRELKSDTALAIASALEALETVGK